MNVLIHDDSLSFFTATILSMYYAQYYSFEYTVTFFLVDPNGIEPMTS